LPKLDYDALTGEEAQAHLDDIVARHPARLAELAMYVAEDGDEACVLDGSIESIRPLWRWYVSWWETTDGAEPGRCPAWWTPRDEERPPLPVAALERVDLVGHYLAEVALRSVPGSHWMVVRRDKRQSWEDRNKPAIAVGNGWMLPFGLPYTLALRVSNGNTAEDALLRIFRNWVGHALPEGTQ
jgi:hypothetical protein